MYKTALLCLGIAIGAALSPALAQDADDTWKGLVMQALYLAGDNKYSQAEATFNKAVHEAERFGADDARVGTTMNSLGLVYRAEKKYIEAENAYRRALAVLDKAYGAESIDVANVNFNIATVMMDQQRHAASLSYLQKTLLTYETILGSTSVKTASVLCMMGDSYRMTKNYPDSISNYKRCADIREADGGIQNPELADALRGLARTYQADTKFYQADSNFKLAEKIVENTAGISSPQLAATIDDHISLLKTMGGRERDIERLGRLAESIRRLQAKSAPQGNTVQTR